MVICISFSVESPCSDVSNGPGRFYTLYHGKALSASCRIAGAPGSVTAGVSPAWQGDPGHSLVVLNNSKNRMPLGTKEEKGKAADSHVGLCYKTTG